LVGYFGVEEISSEAIKKGDVNWLHWLRRCEEGAADREHAIVHSGPLSGRRRNGGSTKARVRVGSSKLDEAIVASSVDADGQAPVNVSALAGAA